MLSVLIYYAFVCAEKDRNICPQCSFICVAALSIQRHISSKDMLMKKPLE